MAQLYVADAGALDTRDERGETAAVDVVAENLALVLHHGRHRDGLAAAAGAIVEHLLSGRRARDGGCDLAAHVLHFDPAFGIGGDGLDAFPAFDRVSGGNTIAVDEFGHRPGLDAFERAARFLGIGLQGVDAQIDGRAGGHRHAFGHGIRPEGAEQVGRQPFGEIALHMRRGDRVGRHQQILALLALQRRRGVIVLQRFLDLADIPAPGVLQRTEREDAGAGGLHCMLDGILAAERIDDEAGNPRAVARTGEARTLAPVADRFLHGRAALKHVAQDFDGRLDFSAVTHDEHREAQRQRDDAQRSDLLPLVGRRQEVGGGAALGLPDRARMPGRPPHPALSPQGGEG